MIIVDTDTGEKFYIENIRRLELDFATIKVNGNTYTLLQQDGQQIAEVSRGLLDDKTRSKLDSLAEFEIDRRSNKT